MKEALLVIGVVVIVMVVLAHIRAPIEAGDSTEEEEEG